MLSQFSIASSTTHTQEQEGEVSGRDAPFGSEDRQGCVTNLGAVVQESSVEELVHHEHLQHNVDEVETFTQEVAKEVLHVKAP